MNIGFSTGSLTKGDFNQGIALLREQHVPVIEISALREKELDPLIDAIDKINLSDFKYISFHAPSKLVSLSEADLINLLLVLCKKGYPIIVHPDVIENLNEWNALGSLLCIENMDKRKPIGRSALDLEYFFNELPNAKFCLDLAHVRQVDPTMGEARLMINKFGNRLVQLHVSTVNAKSTHERLNVDALLAYQKITHLINPEIPVILESPVSPHSIKDEIRVAGYLFNKKALLDLLENAGVSLENFNVDLKSYKVEKVRENVY